MRPNYEKRCRSQTLACFEYLGIPLLFVTAWSILMGVLFPNMRSVVGEYSIDAEDLFTCGVDGTPAFPWDPSRDQIWRPADALSITIGFGQFTFSQVKAIDIAWDLLAGRGGQVLMSLMAYPVVRKSFTRAMEKGPVHLPVVTYLAFDKLSLITLWIMVKDICVRWSWRFLAFIMVIIYIIAFNTIVSAMTGYQTQTVSYFAEPGNGKLIPSADIDLPYEIAVHDAQRIGLEAGARYSPNDTTGVYSTLLHYSEAVTNISRNHERGIVLPVVVNDTQHNPSLFSLQRVLASSGLNVNASNTPLESYRSSITLSNHTFELDEPPLGIELWPVELGYSYSGLPLSIDWLKSSTICQPLRTYKW